MKIVISLLVREERPIHIKVAFGSDSHLLSPNLIFMGRDASRKYVQEIKGFVSFLEQSGCAVEGKDLLNKVFDE